MALIDNNPRLNFGRLIRNIQPTSGEIEAAKSHLASTRSRLQKTFDVKSFNKIGSHARSTAIKSCSDLDFLAVIARNEAKWGGSTVSSDTVIRKISSDLNSRFSLTSVRKDMQAVVINFGRGQKSLDVVPGFFKGFANKRPIFYIPDGYGGWMETSPDAHNSYINKENIVSGEKLKKVGQIIRFWKHSRSKSFPVSSFYIDLLLAQSGICKGVKSYPDIIFSFFQLMHDRQCRGLRDPLDVAGVVYAVQTEAQGRALQLQISSAFLHSSKALVAEQHGDFREANRQWNIVFNGSFL